MSNVQVRNIPDDLHEQLRVRAGEQGTTISEYVLELIRRDLRRPPAQQWLDGVRGMPKHRFSRDEVQLALQAERDRR